MRHIWSLVAGVIIAPLAWSLIAFGQAAMTEKVTLSSSEPDFLFGGLLLVGNYEVVLSTPLHTGVLAVVGGLMLVAVFSPARWRGNAAPADPNAWTPPPPAPPWTPPTVSTPTSETSSDRSS